MAKTTKFQWVLALLSDGFLTSFGGFGKNEWPCNCHFGKCFLSLRWKMTWTKNSFTARWAGGCGGVGLWSAQWKYIDGNLSVQVWTPTFQQFLFSTLQETTAPSGVVNRVLQRSLAHICKLTDLPRFFEAKTQVFHVKGQNSNESCKARPVFCHFFRDSHGFRM